MSPTVLWEGNDNEILERKKWRERDGGNWLMSCWEADQDWGHSGVAKADMRDSHWREETPRMLQADPHGGWCTLREGPGHIGSLLTLPFQIVPGTPPNSPHNRKQHVWPILPKKPQLSPLWAARIGGSRLELLHKSLAFQQKLNFFAFFFSLSDLRW